MNIDLLREEMDALWSRDRYGRVQPEPLVAIAVADDGRVAYCSRQVPVSLERKVREADLAFEEWPELLAPLGPTKIAGGPSYLFPTDLPALSSNLQISTSRPTERPDLSRPEGAWEEGEWQDLLQNRLGPWAIATVDGRVVSVCHTPVAGASSAEAGIWTHPDYRGKGLAGPTTASWAMVARREFKTLFYSTSFENVSSQAVARKLGLLPIGEIWQFQRIT